MKNDKTVLVYLPMPKGSSWRGEGIAQVVEKIIENTSDVNWTIMSNAEILQQASDALSSVENVNYLNFETRSQLVPSQKVKQYIEISFKDVQEHNRLVNQYILNLKIFRVIKKFMARLKWLVGNTFYSFIYSKSFYEKFDYVWVPSPVVPISSNIPKNKLLISFWDPFVFEYSAFDEFTKKYFYFRFSKSLNDCNKIITQSNMNFDYLTNVLNVDRSKIAVCPLATGDMTNFVNEAWDNARETNQLVKYWPNKTYQRFVKLGSVPKTQLSNVAFKTRSLVLEEYAKELTNKSELWRLEKRLGPNAKIFVISTQSRPHKGIHNIFQIIDKLVKLNPDYYFIFTGNVHVYLKKFPQLNENIIQVSRVSNEQLAFLYKIADIAIHPSFVEGGLGTGPQFEASSVGTPCIVNYGRHIKEAERYFATSLNEIHSNFLDIEETIHKIGDVLNNEKTAKENVKKLMQNKISWASVGKSFSQIIDKDV